MPGATLGNWFDQQAESDRQARSAGGAADKPAAADSTAADSAVADNAVDDAPEATSSAGTSAGGGWSSGGWSWSRPSSALSDDTVTSAATEAPGEAGVSASTASGDDDDDWPSRYSWLEDDESDKSVDPDDTPSASTVLAESAGDDVTTAGAAGAAEDKDAPVTRATAVITGDTAESADVSDVSDVSDVGASEAEPVTDDGAADGSYAETATGAGLVTVLPGVPRYHHEDCILIRFMPKDDVQKLTIPDAEKLGCTPCTACQSEG